MPKSSALPSGRRRKPRRRTRLRTGKIADIDGTFLIECQIFDRSEKGARLRMAELCILPDHFKLFDDEFNVLLIATVIWIDDREIGVAFTQGPGSIETEGNEHAALGGRYYAVR